MISSILECKDLTREFHRCPIGIVFLIFIGLAMNNILVVFYKSLSFHYMYSVVYHRSMRIYFKCFVLCGDVIYSNNGYMSKLGAHGLVVSCILLLDDWEHVF